MPLLYNLLTLIEDYSSRANGNLSLWLSERKIKMECFNARNTWPCTRIRTGGTLVLSLIEIQNQPSQNISQILSRTRSHSSLSTFYITYHFCSVDVQSQTMVCLPPSVSFCCTFVCPPCFAMSVPNLSGRLYHVIVLPDWCLLPKGHLSGIVYRI